MLRFRWKCKLCKRSFSGEEYLDLHLKKKHPEVWSEVAINLQAFMFSRVVLCLCPCVRLCACLEVFGDAGEGATSACAHHHPVHPPIGLVPDLRTRPCPTYTPR